MAGYGVIPRRAGDGELLYDRRLSAQEAQARIARVHAPYHQALADLLAETQEQHGMALLLDWHSMPSRAAGGGIGRRGGRGIDIVLGDRHGASAKGGVTRRMRALFEAEGLRVALNAPYAGGYATQTWGRPDEGVQAVQVRHAREHEALVAGLEALGLQMLVDPKHRLPQLNTVRVPDGIDEAQVRAHVLKEWDLEIGAGLGPLKGKVWRIGLMGASATPWHVKICLTALGEALAAQGYRR
jgi:hypothetical protein